MTEYVETTTSSRRRRHLAHPEKLRTLVTVPGRRGKGLCPASWSVTDQERLDALTARSSRRVVIADLPLCKRCAKAAPASQEGGKQ